MKKAIILFLAAACVVAVLIVSGCGGGEQTSQGFEDLTVEKTGEGGESGKVTFEGEGGESSIETSEQIPTEENLGAPIYPGAEYVAGSGITSRTTSGEKELLVSGAEFTTGDAYIDVANWYVQKLEMQPAVAGSDAAEWLYQNEAGKVIYITVAAEEGTVRITIRNYSGDPDIDL